MALERTGPYDYLNPRREWLETTSEEILDPELPIVDAHHPIWAERGNNYQIDDFAEDLASGHNVISSVFAECHYSYFTDGPLELRPVGETKRIGEIADSCDTRGMRTRVCEGIVGFADLRLGHQIAPVLEAHISAANGRFRGIRQLALRDKHFPNGVIVRPGPMRLYADPSFCLGLAEVAKFGLTFDASVYHTQHADVYELARAVPQSTIVLGHFGGLLGVGPYQGEPSTFLEWRDGIQALAACPNIYLKLGGVEWSAVGSATTCE